jgi:hypothetical protein
MSDYDSPWKEAISRYFPLFLAFFFPEAYAAIDWSRGYEVLDKELQQIVREAERGRQLADLLVKVWLKSGTEAWVLIHVEVQSQPEEGFPRRMYVYNYRCFDRYNRAVVSLAVLGDERPDWRPAAFGYELWGCALSFRYPVVKLHDYRNDLPALEANPNPFAAVVLTHLQTQDTRQDAGGRYAWKVRLIKGLYQRGLSREEIREFCRVIDWMMDLPQNLEEELWHEIQRFEEETRMPYLMSFERRAIERGREEGRGEGRIEGLRWAIEASLRGRWGADGMALAGGLAAVADQAQLEALVDAISKAKTLDEVRQAWPARITSPAN